MKPDRRSHRTLAYGLGVSVAIHFVLLAMVRFSAPDLEGTAEPVVTFEDQVPVTVLEEIALAPVQDASPVDMTAPEMEIVGESLEGAAATSAAAPASGQPSPATAPANGDPLLPAVETGAPALAVLADSARAETTSAAEDDDVPVWRPGSVGKAKRQWANNGSGAGERGEGDGVGIFIGRGGGHCPMPGRGRARPPVSWFN